MDRRIKFILGFLLICGTLKADKTENRPVTFLTGSSLTIRTGVTVTGNAGSIWNLQAATVNLPPTTVVAGTYVNPTFTVGADGRISSATTSSSLPLPDPTGHPGTFVHTDGTSYDLQAIAGGGDMLKANNLSDLTNAATARINLGVAIGTNVEAHDADLTSLAAATGLNTLYFRSGIGTWAPVTIGANMTFTGGTLDANASAGGAPTTVKYIVQTADSTLTNEQALGSLATGILKNTTGTGVLTIAAPGTDYYNPGGTDVALADGGTGASDATGARLNLGLAKGVSGGVEVWDSDLDYLATVTLQANVKSILNAADYAAIRGLLGLGTMALQANTGISTEIQKGNGTGGLTPATTFDIFNYTEPGYAFIPYHDPLAGGGWPDPGLRYDLDGTFAANSDTRVASQAATKTYADSKISDAAYDATAWGIDTTHGASKKAIRDALVALPVGGDVNAAATFDTDNVLIRSDGVTKGVQASGVSLDDTTNDLHPTTDDAGSLGDATHQWSDLFLASGGTINFANSNVVLTHSTGALNVSAGDFKVASAGSSSTSVVNNGATQTLTNKTLTKPTMTDGTRKFSSPSADDQYAGNTIGGFNNTGGLTQWNPVYLDSSSNWQRADANGTGTYPARGISVSTVSTGQPAIILVEGVFRDDGGTAWTPGGTIYLSSTAGALTQTAPATTGDHIQAIGYALSAHVVWVDVSKTFTTVP